MKKTFIGQSALIQSLTFGFKVLRFDGLITLIRKLLFVITKNSIFKDGYKDYPLDFSPILLSSIVKHLQDLKPTSSDLIVVPERYRLRIENLTKGHTISTSVEITSVDLASYQRLIWATDRVDRGARIGRHFYDNKKEVLVLKNTGPAKVWMHDHIKETTLQNEFKQQRQEGIEKFGNGIGADFGNLLQLIDNTKDLPGDFVEIGCFMGSSSCVVANYMCENNIKKRFFVYDYFEGFTYPEAKSSIDDTWNNTHMTDGRLAVEQRIRKRLPNNQKQIDVIQRNIIEEDAIREVEKIAFANIDVDLYEAILAALIHVDKKIVNHGIIVVEDAGHTPWLLGARIALEEFLDQVGSDRYLKIQMESGQFLLIKK